MYQSKDRIQNIMLLVVDTVCILMSYFLAGFFWYMLYRGVSFQRMLAELSKDFETALIAYAIIVVFFKLSRQLFYFYFINRSDSGFFHSLISTK